MCVGFHVGQTWIRPNITPALPVGIFSIHLSGCTVGGREQGVSQVSIGLPKTVLVETRLAAGGQAGGFSWSHHCCILLLALPLVGQVGAKQGLQKLHVRDTG